MRRRWGWTEALGLAVCGAVLTALLWGLWGLWGPRALRGHGPAPGPAERVVHDAAGLLDAEQRARIERQHRWLRRDHGIDYRVEIRGHTSDLDAYALRRFEELGAGGGAGDAGGLLLVVDASRGAVRVEVGRSLEGVFPDAVVAYLEHRQMIPFFRKERVADGVLAATELVVERAKRAEAAGGLAPAEDAGRSAGGGARAPIAPGEGEPDFREGPDVPGSASPRAAVRAYLEAMRARNGRAALGLYSRRSRAFLAERVVTPAQMDRVARAYRSCRPEPARLGPSGRRAVVRYPVEERACAPFLLVREEGAWRLDLAGMSEWIGFGRSNAWHFRDGRDHPYAFAFRDWRLDRHGYPHPRSADRAAAAEGPE